MCFLDDDLSDGVYRVKQVSKHQTDELKLRCWTVLVYNYVKKERLRKHLLHENYRLDG